jgi:WXG100 protein secretion system (Wss), protein YukD
VSTLNITVTDAGGAQRNEVSVPGEAAAVKIIAALVNSLNLPLSGPDGSPMSYKFHHVESARQIKDDMTLVAAGVNDGDTLRLIPEIVAG